MKEYTLADEGKRAVLAWLSTVINDEGQQEKGGGGESYTTATVCYHLQDESEKYRRYPVSREQFLAFSSVYDTVEYKEKAYPAITVGVMADARYTWEDGVTETDLKLTEDEKEALALAYREAVEAMSMEDLTEALPAGFVCVDSETGAGSARMPVYPFHEQTCVLLREYGVDIEKTIKDYEICSVEMYEHYGSGEPDVSGGVSRIICDTPEEIEKWSGRLFPERLDLQPLLYPLDHSGNISDIRAEVKIRRQIRSQGLTVVFSPSKLLSANEMTELFFGSCFPGRTRSLCDTPGGRPPCLHERTSDGQRSSSGSAAR